MQRSTRQRDAVKEVSLVEPAALLDEVALHVADGCDRTPEADGAQAEEIPQVGAEPNGP